MRIKELIPWRIRYRLDRCLEERLRPTNTGLYKFLKFGRTNINTAKYWDKVWRTDTSDRDYQELFQLICDRIPAGSRVLDVGCGMGILARRLRETRGASVMALDFSAHACRALAAEGFETIVSKLPAIPVPDQSFDVAVCTEVLEHLDHPERTLTQMFRVVRRGGLVMCSAPDDALHPHRELEHQTAFTRQRFEQLMGTMGDNFEVIQGRVEQSDQPNFLLGILRRS